MVAHTRRRASYDDIVAQLLDAKPDVIMGGGLANFLPKGTAGSKRQDDVDYLNRFRQGGYHYVTNATELKATAQGAGQEKLLGLFAVGNMDGTLDRMFLKGGAVSKFPDQPDLTDQVRVALQILSKNEA